MSQLRPRPSAWPFMAALMLIVGSGCAEDPPTPEEARRDRVEDRLSQTFSELQVRCILDRIDDDLMIVLDLDDDLATDDEALSTYTGVIADCTTDPTGTTTTSTPTDPEEPNGAEDPTDGSPDPATDEAEPDSDAEEGDGGSDEPAAGPEGEGTWDASSSSDSEVA